MGLDMYLNAEHFIWEHGEDAERAANIRKAVKDAMGDTSGKVTNIVTEAAYWRKANAIHKWFVDHVQDGVDECQKSYVTRERLAELVVLCKDTLADVENADETLPTASGFFFGNTDYDEYYEEDLKDTIKMLEPLLDEEKYPPREWDFYYQSSW